MHLATIYRRPSAYLPVLMSLAALAMVLVHVALAGATRQADEGALAHVFQLLIAAQLPIVAFFVIKWLRRSPREAWPVLALQAVAIVAALTPVYLFQL